MTIVCGRTNMEMQQSCYSCYHSLVHQCVWLNSHCISHLRSAGPPEMVLLNICPDVYCCKPIQTVSVYKTTVQSTTLFSVIRGCRICMYPGREYAKRHSFGIYLAFRVYEHIFVYVGRFSWAYMLTLNHRRGVN